MTKEIEKTSVMDKVDWLLSHNKNYTQEQYHTLCDLQQQLDDVLCAVDYIRRRIEYLNSDATHFVDNVLKAMKGE